MTTIWTSTPKELDRIKNTENKHAEPGGLAVWSALVWAQSVDHRLYPRSPGATVWFFSMCPLWTYFFDFKPLAWFLHYESSASWKFSPKRLRKFPLFQKPLVWKSCLFYQIQLFKFVRLMEVTWGSCIKWLSAHGTLPLHTQGSQLECEWTLSCITRKEGLENWVLFLISSGLTTIRRTHFDLYKHPCIETHTDRCIRIESSLFSQSTYNFDKKSHKFI